MLHEYVMYIHTSIGPNYFIEDAVSLANQCSMGTLPAEPFGIAFLELNQSIVVFACHLENLHLVTRNGLFNIQTWLSIAR